MSDNYLEQWNELMEEDDDLDIDDEEDFENPDWEEFTPEEEALANDLFDMIQSFINEEEKEELDEKFTSKSQLNNHFNRHCLAKIPNRKSKRTKVFYDFNDVNKYKIYEDKINVLMQETVTRVPTLNDVRLVCKYMRRLFEGNFNILFTTSCGFYNSNGYIMVGLHSFSSDVTKNYPSQNTIDIILLTAPTLKTITIYPVDANYFETKFNNIIKNHSNSTIQLKINH